MMGAGKTHIGRILAEALDITFYDLDREIEKAAGSSVGDIFEYYGEPAFRDVEKKILRRLLKNGISVISLGGGAIVNDETRNLLKEQSFLIWLKATPETLYSRVSGSTHRPLLQGKNPEAKLKELHTKRLPYYEQAHLTAESDGKSPRQTLSDLLSSMEDRLATCSDLSEHESN